MKLYTKTGDQGKTSLIGGKADKDHLRVEAYGTLDEANSFIGLAQSYLKAEEALFQDILSELIAIQHELFDCGSDLAYVNVQEEGKLKAESITMLEERIDAYVEEAPQLTKFILPGGTEAASFLHAARTVIRRAERKIVALAKEEDIPPLALPYVNRLSDYLFAAARIVNHRLGEVDVEYERSADVFRTKKKL
ncbi:cob(I)yrinic acid a,c-diamide adenosyltransferase [Bacillus haynesii]|uniref:Corrinoid adenosyltransferase n=1 Tax=Bacillus haynesii TaxID=1925021 RepID=A0AA90EY25_9BACI|nr:cob(I)yrinic acid a,c-diamide adenosyltransferase [Bacillus haynesii]MCY7789941.1 cob(I)yrinic acid a,c-diamide adenosyltransferase [Bacillus haynesii]MCY7914191.1 cob(I)yrinic acid a,c-diamide adenosyltransferase [Bacillus haynesii]MCY7924571.1 cob(I)yrinic acid a,c-diamide adenosyltransferase [Bacillus haynesii]MCY8047304.1 cob(I)yrinic acid a,c-diamide adenosyltransferase [Bacillus haynesii]MCY8079564.1 cob(I)yrinic acid a,c-diamide adenosyltransferase [Bacillus haynesii]